MASFPDVATLFLIGSLGGFSVAFVMAVVWLGDRTQRHALFWSASYFLFGLSTLLMALRGHVPDVLSITIAWPVYFLAIGATWLSFREFGYRRMPYDRIIILLGSIAWLLFSFDTDRFGDMNTRVVVLSVICAVYALAAAYEMVQIYRTEPLPALPVFMVMYAGHGVIQSLRAIATMLAPMSDSQLTTLPTSPLTLFVVIETVLVFLLTGMAQLALTGQRRERAFRIAAETDEMTGICNRRHFLEQAVPSVAHSEGNGALLLLDLDHFKVVNDTYGHTAGDVVLSTVTETINRMIAPPDLFARIGGEEFAIYLPNADGPAGVELGERLRAAVSELFIPYRGDVLRITVSCGVAAVADAGAYYDRLHRNADTALYEAKAAGRDRVVAHVAIDRLWGEVMAAVQPDRLNASVV